MRAFPSKHFIADHQSGKNYTNKCHLKMMVQRLADHSIVKFIAPSLLHQTPHHPDPATGAIATGRFVQTTCASFGEENPCSRCISTLGRKLALSQCICKLKCTWFRLRCSAKQARLSSPHLPIFSQHGLQGEQECQVRGKGAHHDPRHGGGCAQRGARGGHRD